MIKLEPNDSLGEAPPWETGPPGFKRIDAPQFALYTGEAVAASGLRFLGLVL